MVWIFCSKHANSVIDHLVAVTAVCVCAQVGTWEKPLAEHIHAGMTKAGLEAVIWPVKEDTESGSLTDRYDGDDLIPN